ncbi:putative oxidoreductase [Penicillium rolfsii]|nr:putative oxidoreductase [Penicillium rolfsii]
MSPPLVWLVTATTSGLGAALVETLLARGDRVIAAGRNAEQRLSSLKLKSPNVALLNLDLSAGRVHIFEQINKACAIFGHIDVLINNAGVSSPSSIEEADDEFVDSIFKVNLFGTLHATQAILPHFRAQRHGTIAFVGAGLAWAPLPFLTHYAASKAALDIFAEGLVKEVGSLGIRSVIFEPGGFASQLGQPRPGSELGFGKFSPSIPDYNALFDDVMSLFGTELAVDIPGDVSKIAERIADVITQKGPADGKEVPVRVILGCDALAIVKQKCTEQLTLAKDWESLSLSTDRDGRGHGVSQGCLKFTSILDSPGSQK